VSDLTWRIPITEAELRLIESTPGALEYIEAEVNREFLVLLRQEIARMEHEFMHGTGTGTPVGILS
jgi:hypothetical protein